ncbi:regulatory protein, luxR family [Streptoalloteichus hindustanus]|uniref:Regulatory protein, luxR family n=1 Tax=Streptoalloteichus hindustanus TaxID=2017 RepID=A0A1M5NCX5_STRHI|nr:regulatory protein, luxR family [Streptoalloteichus hindustanus]
MRSFPSRSTFVEVVGEPGIGKTRLLAEFGATAAARGHRVVRGGGSEFEQEVPFGCFLGVFEELLTAGGDDPLVAAVVAGQPVSSVAAERHRIYRAVRRLLAAAGGGVLVLDDLHWADRASLELLSHLLRHPPACPLLVVGAYRPRQCPPRLAAAVAETAPGLERVRMEVGPLSEAEVAELLGRREGAALPRRLFLASGGNPFYLEVLRHLPTTWSSGPLPSWDGELPAPVLAALRRELVDLPAEALAVARAAAVVGDPVDPGLLPAVADLTEDAALTGLTTVVERDLVRPDEGRRSFRFRHPLVRGLVYRDSSAGWRLAAHHRARRALAARGGGPLTLAPHVLRSAAVGDLDAVVLLRRAATDVLDTSPATAVEWLRGALALLPLDSVPGWRLEILLMKTRALAMTGDLDKSRAILHDILASAPRRPLGLRAALVAQCALVERILGHYTTASGMLATELAEPALEREPDLSHPLRVELATVAALRGRFEQSQEVVAPLLDHADRAVATAAHAVLAIGGAHTGAMTQARESVERAAAGVDAMSDRELSRVLDAVGQLGWAETLLEQHVTARRHLERGLDLSRRFGQNQVVTYFLLGQCYAAVALGELTTAVELAEDAAESARLIASRPMTAMAYALRAGAELWLAGPESAAPWAERAVAATDRHTWWWDAAGGALTRVRLAQGRFAEARDLLADVLTGAASCMRPSWLALWGDIAMAGGDPAEARRSVSEAVAEATDLGLAGQRGNALISLARIDLVEGRPDRAGEAAREAAHALHGVGQPLTRARALVIAAEAALAVDDVAGAAEHVRQAKAIARERGATGLRPPVLDLERRLGARLPRPPETAAVATLTERERQIARLLAVGLSNKEIADRLVIAPRTVETHVTRVLRKLAIRSRAGVAQLLPDLDHR